MRTLLSARIETDRAQYDCVIRNLSDTGAKLVCAERIDPPDAFDLVLTRARSRRRVRVVWRNALAIGVRAV